MRCYESFKSVVMFFLFVLAAPHAHAAGASTYEVTVNTAPLVGHPGGPFSIQFVFTDGSGLADANNSVSVTNVNFGGGNSLGAATLFGGANGSLESGIVMTDGSPLSLFSEAFSPGQFLRFTVLLTTSDDDGGIPDRLVFYILDSSGNPIPSLSPAADFLVGIDLRSAGAAVESFGTDRTRSPSNGNPIAINAPTVTSDTIPPVTTASVSPSPNANGWNSANVTVMLNSTDNEPGSSGVKQVTYNATGAQTIGDTIVSGESATFAISEEGVTIITFFGADNAGNIETAKTISVQIDKTPPTVTCNASPNVLWPPNNKLAPVYVSVNVTDSLSGPAGFNLVSVTSSEPDCGHGDIQGFVVGTPSTSGRLRAKRLGSGSGRTYTFVYSGVDRAGNARSCITTVVVPHDQGH